MSKMMTTEEIMNTVQKVLPNANIPAVAAAPVDVPMVTETTATTTAEKKKKKRTKKAADDATPKKVAFKVKETKEEAASRRLARDIYTTAWRVAGNKYGYVLKGGAYKPLPALDTKEYEAIRQLKDRLAEEWFAAKAIPAEYAVVKSENTKLPEHLRAIHLTAWRVANKKNGYLAKSTEDQKQAFKAMPSVNSDEYIAAILEKEHLVETWIAANAIPAEHQPKPKPEGEQPKKKRKRQATKEPKEKRKAAVVSESEEQEEEKPKKKKKAASKKRKVESSDEDVAAAPVEKPKRKSTKKTKKADE